MQQLHLSVWTQHNCKHCQHITETVIVSQSVDSSSFKPGARPKYSSSECEHTTCGFQREAACCLLTMLWCWLPHFHSRCYNVPLIQLEKVKLLLKVDILTVCSYHHLFLELFENREWIKPCVWCPNNIKSYFRLRLCRQDPASSVSWSISVYSFSELTSRKPFCLVCES